MPDMIALITGAAGGIGEEFIKALIDNVDVIWAVGRNNDRLNALSQKYGSRIKPYKADLAKESDIRELCLKIQAEKPEIRYLVNNAGVARMAPVAEFSLDEISNLLEVNIKAASMLCRAAIPCMARDSYILNIASASAFQPNPYIALYSASKSYLLSLTRSLNVELKDAGVTCTAVCPGWVDTDMIPEMSNGKKIHYPGMVTPGKVVRTALYDCRKGKDVSVCSGLYRFLRFYSKVMPHKVIMRLWVKGIKGYL